MALVERLVRQRRFKFLFVGLVVLAMLLGLLVVPIEVGDSEALIKTWHDGLWWAATTITSVGYGDYYPVTLLGKVLGVVLEVVGVLAFGLLIGMFTVALDEGKNRFYWQRLYDRLDKMEKKMEKQEKREEFVVKQMRDNGEAEGKLEI